jgi:hypothetical protein
MIFKRFDSYNNNVNSVYISKLYTYFVSFKKCVSLRIDTHTYTFIHMPKTTSKTATVKDMRPGIYNVTIYGETNRRLTEYTKSKGFTNVQEVIRIALTDFLTKQGY